MMSTKLKHERYMQHTCYITCYISVLHCSVEMMTLYKMSHFKWTSWI